MRIGHGSLEMSLSRHHRRSKAGWPHGDTELAHPSNITLNICNTVAFGVDLLGCLLHGRPTLTREPSAFSYFGDYQGVPLSSGNKHTGQLHFVAQSRSSRDRVILLHLHHISSTSRLGPNLPCPHRPPPFSVGSPYFSRGRGLRLV